MDNNVELLRTVLGKMGTVLAGITTDDLDKPTPCSDYTVRGLRDHLVGWDRAYAAYAVGQSALDSDGTNYRAGADPLADFQVAARQLVDGLGPRRMDDQLDSPWGLIRIGMLVDELMTENLIHAWDLAEATGQHVAYTDDEILAADDGLSANLAESYAEEGFADPVSPDGNADLLHRLLARSGRRVTDTRIAGRAIVSTRPGNRR